MKTVISKHIKEVNNLKKFEDCIYKEVCENECKQACIRYVEMGYLLKTSNIPKAKQKVNTLIPENCDVSAFQLLAEIRDDIVNFVKSGKSLYLFSHNCGNGKTTWAIKLMLQYFNEIWAGNGFKKRGIFISVPNFLYKCKSVMSDPDPEFEILRKDLFTVDLVIWDDVAAADISNYDYSVLFTFLDARIVNEKSNIFTSNIRPEDLDKHIGTKLRSRLCCSEQIALYGGDRR